MTLNELVDSVSKLKGWKAVREQGIAGLAVPQAGNRKQAVAVSQFENEGRAMLRFTSRIGETEHLEESRLLSALKLNIRMPHGRLAVDGTHLVKTDTRPLQTSTPETTGGTLEFIARQADQHERLIYKTDVH